MAPPAKAVNPPQSLPGNFFDNQPAQTLPADFDFGGTPTPTVQSHEGELTQIQPHQMPHSAKEAGKEVVKGVGNIGAGGLGTLSTIGRLSPWGAVADRLMGGPTIYEQGYDALTHPKETAKSAGTGLLESAKHPLETAEGLIGGAGATAGIGELNRLIPSTGRAARVLGGIESQAAHTPLTFENTGPAINRFQEYVNTGGKPSQVMGKLIPRAEEAGNIENPRPINFPEARKFYTNVSKESSQPNYLRRLLENPKNPAQRYELGNVRSGMHSDLVRAAEDTQPGLGEKYQGAIDETRRAQQMNRLLRRAGYGVGAYAGSKLLKEMGILGDVANKIPGGQQ